jgi:hypothetical protein
MNTAQQQSRRAYADPHTRSGRDIPEGQTGTPATAPRKHLSLAEMEELEPIKMQHAAALFVIEFLKARNCGWHGVETEVGGEDDLRGIDFHLINSKEGIDIPVDFSTSSKGGFAVKLEREWFKEGECGKLVFLANNASVLFNRFAPAMNPNNRWDLLGWKLAQRA